MLSAFLGSPEIAGKPVIALSQDEAHALAEAIGNVQRHYPLSKLNAKTVDWINLAQVLGMVYGTRAVAVIQLRRGKRDKPKPAEVVNGPWQPPPPIAS